MPNFLGRHILIFVAGLFFSQIGFAQEEESKTNPWKFKSAVGFSYFEGNVEKLDTRVSLDLSKTDSIVEYSSSYQFIYGELNQDKNNLLHDFAFTVDFLPYSNYSPFAGFFLFNNIYKGFRLRNSYLVGVKRKILETEKSSISLSAAMMYDYILYGSNKDEVEEPDLEQQILRFSIRPKFKLKLSDQISLNHVSFWQPELENVSNYIFTADSSLDFDVRKNLSLGIDYLYYFNNNPPYNSIRKRDQKFMLSLKFSI